MAATTYHLSRRKVLGLAAGGALGAAGLRFGLIELSRSAGDGASAAGPAGAWESPLGQSRALAAHLLRRAGFGYTSAELDAAASMRYSDLVEQVTSQTPDIPSAPPATGVSYQSVSRWWLEQMATTRAQFPERMAFFWHGHFTSDYRKAANTPFVWIQNQLYRRMGSGSDLRSFLLSVTTDPLMMRYLDLDQSSAKAPNENFSREVMELYTLGVGNYSEQDVREGARALSGLRIAYYDPQGNRTEPPRYVKGQQAEYLRQLGALLQQGASFRGVLMESQHDTGSKTFLGRTGNLGPEEVVDTLLAQESCAPFIATRALQHFCTPQPSASLVTSVASQFRSSGYSIPVLMRAIFTSSDFTSDANYRSLVRSPVDYMVATMRATSRPGLVRVCAEFAQPMDQILYDMPTVAGWPGNAAWLTSATVLARLNMAQAVVSRGGALPDPMQAVRDQLDGVVGADTARVLNASTTTPDRWYAILAGPEFHLK